MMDWILISIVQHIIGFLVSYINFANCKLTKNNKLSDKLGFFFVSREVGVAQTKRFWSLAHSAEQSMSITITLSFKFVTAEPHITEHHHQPTKGKNHPGPFPSPAPLTALRCQQHDVKDKSSLDPTWPSFPANNHRSNSKLK